MRNGREAPGRVGVLRCRYRLRGAGADPRAVGRLERLAAERLPDELDVALAAMAADGAVYVVRRVRAVHAAHLAASDSDLARRWGAAVARAVARTISDGGPDVARFASHDDYVAAFVAELLAGRAWQRWWFGAFAVHRHRPVAEAAVAVLTADGVHLPAVLAGVARRGRLDTLLECVDARRLGLGRAALPPAGALDRGRPIVAAAVAAVDDLGWWCGGGTPDLAGLVRAWAALGAPEPDWRDPADLADAVAAVVAWLVERGTARPAGRAVTVDDLVRLDWVDRSRLAAALARVLAPAGLPLRAPGATPRQRRVLTALGRAVRARRPALDVATPAANAARLVAALAETDPEIASDPLAASLVEQVLVAWSAGSGGLPQSTAERACAVVARLGEPAAAVLAELGHPAPSGAPVASPVAGVLLLARPLLDLRLAASAGRLGYPPAGAGHLVAALGLRWSGPAADAETLDVAVRLLAGDGAPRTRDELEAAWRDVPAGDHDRWRLHVDELVAAHRVDLAAPPPDPLDHTAEVVLRVWARWMRGFERSSAGFVLDQFVRRPGTVVDEDDTVTVHLPRRPLDTVLEMSGYLRPVVPVPGMPGRRIAFVLGDLR